MATSQRHRGWRWDAANSRLDVYVDGTKVAYFNDSGSYLTVASGLTVTAGGLTVTAGGATITAGGLTVTAGGATVTAGGLTVNGGDVLLRGGNALVNKVTTTNITTAGAGTYSAANLLGGRITRDPNGLDRTDTTDTAANIVGAITGASVGDSFICVVENTADALEAITLAGGTGVTLERLDGTGATIAQNGSAVLLFVLTNVTSGSEAVSAYVIAS
jgi:hypothetical protein